MKPSAETMPKLTPGDMVKLAFIPDNKVYHVPGGNVVVTRLDVVYELWATSCSAIPYDYLDYEWVRQRLTEELTLEILGVLGAECPGQFFCLSAKKVFKRYIFKMVNSARGTHYR